MKRQKNFKGFTLIELIVVIAIIGVLAAILVPAMMGWVRRSQITTNNNNASEVCTQLQIIFTDIDSTRRGSLDTNCIIEYDGHDITSTSSIDDELKAEIMAINTKMTDMSKAKWAAEIKNNTVEAVIFTNNDYKQVGGFPKQCTADYVTAGKDISTFLNCAKTSW